MTRIPFIVAFIGLLLGVLGCGVSNRPKPPSMDKAEVGPAESSAASEVIVNLIEDSKRLMDIEYSLTTASAGRCGALARPQSGIILFRSEFFEDHMLRKTVSWEYALDEDLRVLHVVPRSSAEKAGVQVGDELKFVDGEEMTESAELWSLLLKLAERSKIEIVLERDGERLEKTIELERGCPVVFKLTSGFELITRATMQLMVAVPPGLMHAITDDDTLAAILAHELAHTCFDDKSKSWPEQEARADRLGLIIAAQAGFDVNGAEKYWERVAMEYPWLIDEVPGNLGPLRDGFEGYAHYGIGNRMAAIRKTVAEINARIAAASVEP